MMILPREFVRTRTHHDPLYPKGLGGEVEAPKVTQAVLAEPFDNLPVALTIIQGFF